MESEKCPSFYKARKADRPTYTRIDSTLADGLAVPVVGYNAFATANPLIDKLVVVKEEWIAIAILKLVENEKCIVEGAGATGLAAILAGQLEELKGKRLLYHQYSFPQISQIYFTLYSIISSIFNTKQNIN